MGLQGVPQTGKIIEVKKTTFRIFFFEFRGVGGFVLGCMARSDVSGALVILTDMAKTELKLFCLYLKQNRCQFVCVIVHNFTNLMCIFFAGLTRTVTKIGGDLLPHPQTPFM